MKWILIAQDMLQKMVRFFADDEESLGLITENRSTK
jgi:hypothetical protein